MTYSFSRSHRPNWATENEAGRGRVKVLVFNPGSNSLKAAVLRYQASEAGTASDAEKLIEVICEGIGHEAKLSVYQGKKIAGSEPIEAGNFSEAAASVLQWLARRDEGSGTALSGIECACVRVVHGGPHFTGPVEITAEVEREIKELEKWAPLHNHRSIEILEPLRERLAGVPIFAAFDTAFHRTIEEVASLYPIPLEVSRRHAIRRYGFHGLSHRYLMERYAAIARRSPARLKLVTLHLESGCSATAIEGGRSIDTTMGLTPLEGLMMGTRCGDVDPALPAYLMNAENLDMDGVMHVLEKQSGLLGVSGKSLDTRVLMREYGRDERVTLAMDMFSYRVLKAVGSYLAVLGGADAIVFGGGIGENTPLVRERVCEGLSWCGVKLDAERNRRVIDVEGRLSTEDSRIQVYTIPVEESLQIAHECCRALEKRGVNSR
jgi:acetate kinase